MIYLDALATIPLILIWLSNILIGYATVGKHKIPRAIRPKIKRMQSQARKKANLPKIASKEQQKKTNENTPVWLNSFLSIFVPSCFVHTADPAMFADTEDLTDKEKEDHEEVMKEFFAYEKSFQQKVIKHQVKTSTTFLMITLGIVFYLVNFTEFKYNNNIFSNVEFNILCGMIFGLGVISYLFLFGIDIFDLLHLNDKPAEGGKITIKYKEKRKEVEEEGEDVPDGVNIHVELPGNPEEVEYIEEQITTKKHGPVKKILVCIFFTLLAISPIIAGFAYSNLGTNTPAYVVLKMEQNHTIHIWMAKSRLLNNPSSRSKKEVQGLLQKCDIEEKRNVPRCQNKNDNKNKEILLVDMNSDCLKELSNNMECLSYKAIILMENWDNSSSHPVDFDSKGVHKFPIISVSQRDSAKFKEKFQYMKGIFLNIIFDNFDQLLEKEDSDIYEINCDENGCTSMDYPKKASARKYIGCDGEVKFRAEVKMSCTSFGRRCAELETWKRKVDKEELKYERCFHTGSKEKMPFPPAHCVRAENGKENMPKSCDQEESFWIKSATSCWKPETKTVKYWKRECKNEVDCSQWGGWSAWTKTTCTMKSPKERFRFCRKSKACVLMEHEKKYKKYNETGTCTDYDQKEEYDQIKECKYL